MGDMLNEVEHADGPLQDLPSCIRQRPRCPTIHKDGLSKGVEYPDAQPGFDVVSVKEFPGPSSDGPGIPQARPNAYQHLDEKGS